MTRLILATMIGMGLATSAPALAQDAGAVFTAEPAPQLAAHHPLSLELGLGFAVMLDGGQVMFKLSQGVAYHVSGSDEGFHVGLMLGEAVADNHFFFDVAARVGYDLKFHVNRDLDFGVDPYLGLGLGYTSLFGAGEAAFLLQPGIEAKLFIGETIYVFLRPLQFSIYARDHTTSTFDFLAGAGLRF